MTKKTLLNLITGGPARILSVRDAAPGPDKLIVQWRVKSQAPFLCAHDVKWTRFGRVSDTAYGRRMVRAMNREDPVFEYRLKP